MGHFDEAFLAVPAECLITSMKAHQKCFSLRDPKTGKLANKLPAVSNLIAKDGGKADRRRQREGDPRAAVSDARFFWEQDLKRPLDEMAQSLDGITFHEKLGSAEGSGRADRGAGVPDRRRVSTRCPRTRGARRSCARPISSRAWSASFRSCRG